MRGVLLKNVEALELRPKLLMVVVVDEVENPKKEMGQTAELVTGGKLA
jgi:hypothetical protein